MLSKYVTAGLFIPLDLFFAQRVLSEQKEVLEEQIALLAVLLALFRQGHLALPLEGIAKLHSGANSRSLRQFGFFANRLSQKDYVNLRKTKLALRSSNLCLEASFAIPSLENIKAALERLPSKGTCDLDALAHLVHKGISSFPPEISCVCIDENAVYLQKNFLCEKQIALDVLRLMNSPITRDTQTHLLKLNTEQHQALKFAQEHALSLLIGGPGTGKTYTAAHIVKALQTTANRRIVLAAPTGKAVAQLDAYLHNILPELSTIHSATLHSLLGIKREGDVEAEAMPLCADVIIVDECSMIDARLFSRLLSSVPEGSRLILIGDPHQLPAVETGSVFSDLIDAFRNGLPLAVTELTKTLRSERDELLRFSTHICTGQSALVVETLSEQKNACVTWKDLEARMPQKMYDFLWNSYNGRFPHFFKEKPAAAPLMKSLNAFRLLSCMRQGIFGVDAINQFFKQRFLQEAEPNSWWAIPLLITRSDAALQLYNGDTGILIRRVTPERELGQEDYAIFADRTQKEEYRYIPALALPDFEWGYCLSVHKSQGSEYDDVAILIPEGAHLFGKEVLYTAVTRAKKSVCCIGALDVITKVVQNSARKISGLSARLQKYGVWV